MSRRRITFVDVVSVFGIGIVCLPVFLVLMPYIEQGRTEARLAVTYHDVRRLSKSAVAGTPGQVVSLPERDPWDQPYRLVSLENGNIRVVSSGPNKSFPASGIDEDDVYSDMPTSPTKPIIARKKRQAMIALAVTVGTWIFFSCLYIRYSRPRIN